MQLQTRSSASRFPLGEISQCAELFVTFLERFLGGSVHDALQILAKRSAEISRGCVIMQCAPPSGSGTI